MRLPFKYSDFKGFHRSLLLSGYGYVRFSNKSQFKT
jgi:hypothetical protein